MRVKISKKVKLYYLLSICIGVSLTIFGAISYLFLIKSGFNYKEIGIYLSVFWITSMIFEIPTGILVDLYGHKNTIIISNVIRIIGLYFLAYNRNYFYFLILSAILTGFAEAILSGNLSSWIVNEINKSKIDISLNTIFSKVSLFGTIVGLISGYLGSEYLYKIDIKLPFIASIVIFIFITILISIIFEKDSLNINKKNNNIKNPYIKMIEEIKIMILKKEFYYLILLYLIIDLINIGPSEQWQVIYENIFINLGIIWIFIGFSGIIGSFITSKISIEKISTKRNILILIIIDILVVFIQSLGSRFIVLFFVHIILFTILGIELDVYKHSDVIKDDGIRATAVSVINTFDALQMTILLSLNGILSSYIGILNTWKVFLVVSLIILIMVSYWKEIYYDKEIF